MARYNNGMIYTNDNCIGCNKCIFECPVIGANVSVNNQGKNQILVNEKKCIHCGHCLSTCTHNAREYRDDTQAFFDDLASGKEISIAVAPSFYMNYPDKANKILGYLKAIGAKKIYDVGYGADIATYCHLKYFEQKEKAPQEYPGFLSKNCSAIVNYAECCAPETIESFIPIHSPVICLGIYVHKYLGDKADIAFISPCVAKKDEIDSPETGGNIKYNVTFKHLMKYIERIAENNFDESDNDKSDNDKLDAYYAESDLKPLGLGGIFPIAGGFKEYVENFLSRDKLVLQAEGFPGRYQVLCSYCEQLKESEETPCLVDILHCAHGCYMGPATEADDFSVSSMLAEYSKVRKSTRNKEFRGDLPVEERLEEFAKKFSELNVSDFHCEFRDRYQQPYSIPESTYDEIFNIMHKFTPQDRSVNCHSCGYATCRDMVTAIAYGYNRMENCVHYTKDEMARLYYTDYVTGINNKAAFLRDAKELIQRNPDIQYVICTADINNFTAVNDMFGFEAGNNVLRLLSSKALKFTKEVGVCARLDTDHFALCFPYSEEKMTILQLSPFYDCHELKIDFPITLRFGLYIVDNTEERVDKMLDLAAIAMSKGEDRSRNTFIFYNNELRKNLLTEASVTSQMREALENEEFQMYLQPQYNHASGDLIGAEALCRWIKPDGSILSPGIFIPIFEKNGFICELDRYMWEKAFALVRKWLDEGIEPVPISTNISRISLQNINVADVLIELGRKYNVNPALVHLEITESAYIHNQLQIIQIINDLRENGFLIAMDDFGSGYSSLNTLKNVPFDILKLDMGFLRGTDEMDKGGNIISSIIRMAQTLQLSTIAEGVETVNQADFLKSVGCDVIQGFLYAKPMPISQYEQLFAKSAICHGVKRPSIMKNIDIDKFFNPDSSETKMFDYYAGAAILFEYEDGEMSIVRINDKYIRTLGLDKQSFESIRMKFMEELLPKSRDYLRRAIEAAIETGEETICLTQRKGSKDGNPIWIKSHIWCVASNGNRYTMYGLAENISAEKNSELALLQANEQMEMIVENLPIGICLFKGRIRDCSSGRGIALKPITVNRSFMKLTGYSREEIEEWTEDDIMKLIHQEDVKAFDHAVTEAINTTLTFAHTFRACMKDGSYQWIKVDSAAVQQEDGSLWIIANLSDCSAGEKESR